MTAEQFVGTWNQQFQLMSDDETDEAKRKRKNEMRQRMTNGELIKLILSDDMTFAFDSMGTIALGTWDTDGRTVTLRFEPEEGVINAASFRAGEPMVLDYDGDRSMLTCVDIDLYEYFFGRLEDD